MNDTLSVWVVYDHPRDYITGYLARRLTVEGGVQKPTADVIRGKELGTVRGKLETMGLVCLTRNEGDDPVIVESWL